MGGGEGGRKEEEGRIKRGAWRTRWRGSKRAVSGPACCPGVPTAG